MDPNTVMAWIQVGSSFVPIANVLVSALRAAAARDPAADLATLDALDADYQRRIDRRLDEIDA